VENETLVGLARMICNAGPTEGKYLDISAAMLGAIPGRQSNAHVDRGHLCGPLLGLAMALRGRDVPDETLAIFPEAGLATMKSRVPEAGRGLFALAHFPPRTLITVGFGHAWDSQSWAAMEASGGITPLRMAYAMETRTGTSRCAGVGHEGCNGCGHETNCVIDPTPCSLRRSNVSNLAVGSRVLGFLANEPPASSCANAYPVAGWVATPVGAGLEGCTGEQCLSPGSFYLVTGELDIVPGEEILMDYGPSYPRNYERGSPCPPMKGTMSLAHSYGIDHFRLGRDGPPTFGRSYGCRCPSCRVGS
jgi:hypothetical protein